jgi:hypothetical protein
MKRTTSRTPPATWSTVEFDYEIVIVICIDELKKIVDAMIDGGWKPLGGATFGPIANHVKASHWIQTMVKRKALL